MDTNDDDYRTSRVRQIMGVCIRVAKEADCKSVLAIAGAQVRVLPLPRKRSGAMMASFVRAYGSSAAVAQQVEQPPFKRRVGGS